MISGPLSSGSLEKRAPVCEVSAQEHNTVLARAQKPRPLDPKTSSLTTELPTKKKWKARLIFPQIKTTREIRKSGNKKFNKQSNVSVEFFVVIRKQTWNGHVLRRLWKVEFFVLPFGIERRRWHWRTIQF